jgi:hypothetical protein
VQAAYQHIACPIQGCGAAPGRSTEGPPWAGEIALLLMTAAYLGVILFLTSRRSQVTRSTLAIGVSKPYIRATGRFSSTEVSHAISRRSGAYRWRRPYRCTGGPRRPVPGGFLIDGLIHDQHRIAIIEVPGRAVA